MTIPALENRRVQLTIAAIGYIGFVLSLAYHVLTFSDVPVAQNPPWPIFVLMPLMFLVFGSVALLLGQKKKISRTEYFTWAGQKKVMKKMVGNMPWWAILILYSVFAYATVNFFLCLPDFKAHDPGLGVGRGFSGHLMVFYLYPALWLTFGAPAQEGDHARGA